MKLKTLSKLTLCQVGSRRVIVYTAFIMLVMGVFGKFCALFVSIPEPVVGGVFTVMCGLFILMVLANYTDCSV